MGHLAESAHDALGADARVPVATEELLEGAVEAGTVDGHAASLKLAGELGAGLLISGEDAARQTERRGVDNLNGLLGGLKGDDGAQAEDLYQGAVAVDLGDDAEIIGLAIRAGEHAGCSRTTPKKATTQLLAKDSPVAKSFHSLLFRYFHPFDSIS